MRRYFFLASLLMAGFGMVGAWLVARDPTNIIASITNFEDFLLSPWMLATYSVSGALFAFGCWYFRSSPARARRAADPAVPERRQGRRLAVVFACFALALTAIGFFFVQDLYAAFRTERFSQQAAVARLKAQQVDKWLFERSIDTELLAASLKSLPLNRMPADREVAQIASLLLAEFLSGQKERMAVTLFALDGKVLLHAGDGRAPDAETTQAAIDLAKDRRSKLRILDVHIDNDLTTASKVRMGFLAPVMTDSLAGSVDAILAVLIDPSLDLLPQIAVWPTQGPTSETLLVRRDGDNVTYITPPKLIEPMPGFLEYRLPVSQTDRPAVMAVLEGKGVREGIDYRGVEQLSASDRVTGVPWTVVTKTDTDEVMQPLRRKITTIVIVIGVTLLLAAGLMVTLWRGQIASQVAFRERVLEKRHATSEHFAQLTRLARDIILLLDPNDHIVEANQAAVTAYGYSEQELLTSGISSLRPPEEQGKSEDQWRGAEATDGVLFETVHQRKDGTTFPVEVSGRTLDIDGKRYRQAFIRDISKRKNLEQQVVRLSRVQRALLVASSNLLRAESETQLYETMCNVLIDLGGYRMAAVALPSDDAGQTIRYGAIAGVDDGYLELAKLSWGHGPSGQGPTGIAFRSGEIQINQDFATNPQMTSWREEARKHGYGSSISLPLRTSGIVFGVLILCAAETNAFDTQEVSVLAQLTQDISYGITYLRATARRIDAGRTVVRLSKVNAALQGATRVLLRTRSSAEIYQEICEVLVQFGGYRLASIATPNDDAGKTVRFVAIAGSDDGYLAQTAITWGDGARSRGPTGAALHTGLVQTHQDFANNATMAPWREEALKHGLRASIGLPIRRAGRTIAALTIYAEEPHAFESDEVIQLTALAEDISWAMAMKSEQPGAGSLS